MILACIQKPALVNVPCRNEHEKRKSFQTEHSCRGFEPLAGPEEADTQTIHPIGDIPYHVGIKKYIHLFANLPRSIQKITAKMPFVLSESISSFFSPQVLEFVLG